MSVHRLHHYSFEDYLRVETDSGIKHEFLDGEIYAMAGGTVLHAGLTSAATVMLGNALPVGCRTYTSDLQIRVSATGLATYPDVSVVCGPAKIDPEGKHTVVNPIVLVEVLSPSTIDWDLGKKFEHYQQIPSLQAVVYVWQDRRRIEVRSRDGEQWRSEITEGDGTARIEALGCALDVKTLYTRAGA